MLRSADRAQSGKHPQLGNFYIMERLGAEYNLTRYERDLS